MSKGSECSEDDEATLPKVKEPSRPFFPPIVQVNHLTRREEKPAFLSLSGPQTSELFGIRDGEMGIQPSHSNSQPKTTAKPPVRHNNNNLNCLQ